MLKGGQQERHRPAEIAQRTVMCKAELQEQQPTNVEFSGWIPKERLRELYAGAKTLIFPWIEDFGIIRN